MAEFFPTRWRYDRPPSLEKFMADFPDDYACAEYLAKRRWGWGFRCPQCGGTEAWRLEARPWVYECKGNVAAKGHEPDQPRCRHQTSVIAGTVMHGTHLPLRKWFLAAYLMATHSNGISALQLQSKLGLGNYKTAWLLLHKLRRAMVDPDRRPLSGEVEVDETFMAYRKKTDPVRKKDGGRSLIGQMAIVGAVEVVDKRYSGRLRLERVPNATKDYLQGFIWNNVERGSIVRTDAWKGYEGLTEYEHVVVNLSAKNALAAHILLPQIHRVFSNFKRWAMGTYHGLREKHVDSYCNEFVFRWNRRRAFQSSMNTMLRIGKEIGPVSYRSIVGDTRAWKKQHQAMILKLVAPSILIRAKDLAHKSGCDIFDAINDVREAQPRHRYSRRPSARPILPPRRQGEERNTRRYIHPPSLVPAIDGTPPLSHIPLTSQLLIPRSRVVENSVA